MAMRMAGRSMSQVKWRPSILAYHQRPFSSSLTCRSDTTKQPAADKQPVADKQPAADAVVHKISPLDQGFAFGANHWILERMSAIALVPLIATQFVYGAHPITDGLLGVVLPFHIHMGFDSCIIDYIPKRVYPRLHRISMWSLKASTVLVMWGCYEFNTNDIGITEAIGRIWTA